MKKKSVGGEFMKGLLEGLSAGSDTSSFHTSVFKHASETIRARFRDLK